MLGLLEVGTKVNLYCDLLLAPCIRLEIILRGQAQLEFVLLFEGYNLRITAECQWPYLVLHPLCSAGFVMGELLRLEILRAPLS